MTSMVSVIVCVSTVDAKADALSGSRVCYSLCFIFTHIVCNTRKTPVVVVVVVVIVIVVVVIVIVVVVVVVVIVVAKIL